MNSENRFEQIAGMAILSLLVIGCFVVLRPFVSALLLALILSYSTFPVYAWFERILKGRRGLGGDVDDVTGCLISTRTVNCFGLKLGRADRHSHQMVPAPYR